MRPIDRHLYTAVDWKPTGLVRGDDDIPVATHEGVLDFMGFTLRCYTLDDGRRIIDGEDTRAMMVKMGLVDHA